MNKIFAFIALLLLQNFYAQAQSFSINTTGTAAHASAMLDVTSTTKGLLIPRLTTAQRTAIASPGKGLLVYDSTLKSFYFHDGVNWQQINADSNNLWRKNGNDIYNSNTGNVGIGISTPNSLLNVRGGAVLFDSTIGTTPVSGAGTRLMWIPAKGAFRAGAITGNQWDDVNIGFYSTAVGYKTTAKGDASTAIGHLTTATGLNSIAMGFSTTASGWDATAIGNFTTASGNDAFAMGSITTASGTASIAMGNQCIASNTNSVAIGILNTSSGYGAIALGAGSIASGYGSTTMGNSTTASGSYSTTMGNSTTASGEISTSMGIFTKSKSYAGLAIGLYNDSTNAASSININSLNRLFQIGNGTADNARSNAMTVLQNGNVGIGTTTPAYMLTVKNDINVDNGGGNAGTVTNALKFGANGTGEAIGSNRNTGVNQWGLDFYTLSTNRMCISLGGNVGIGETTPTVPLNFASSLGDKISLWGNGVNHYGFGIQPSLMQLYTMDASNDIAFGYGNSAGFNENMRLTGAGDESLKGSLTVQNGMGIIRNNSSTQLKKQTKAVTVNVSLASGTTTSIALTWPTSFSAGTVEAYVGNITSGGGWAEMIVSVTNVTTTGATLYINNPQSGTLTPNFVVNVIAIGPQ